MTHIHFIAIGGAAMHNFALAVAGKAGYKVTGSDDEIFDPALSRLKAAGLLPEMFLAAVRIFIVLFRRKTAGKICFFGLQ